MQVFYSPAYLVPGSAFETVEKAAWIADSLTTVPVPGVELVAPPPLAPGALHRAHDEVYVDAVRAGVPRELAESQGFPWSERLFPAACASTAGVLAAMRAARASGVAGSLSSGLHHARRATGADFCTFNGLALAALTALDEGARAVLVLDLDAHCGGGTASIVAHEPRIHHADVAVNDYDAWPPDGLNTLAVVHDAARYLDHVADALHALDARRAGFDLCLYNAGVDVCTGESDDTGRVITAAAVAERERRVFAWCRAGGVPVAFVLAGGYLGGTVGRAELVALHRSTIEAAARSARFCAVSLRPARDEDYAALARIERESDARFAAAGHPELADGSTMPAEAARAAIAQGRITVAEVDGAAVGWAYVGRVDGELCVGQLCVTPAYGGRGVGAELLRHVVDGARRSGEGAVVLNTQADVAWNRAWYEREGFVVVPRASWTPGMRAIAREQTQGGLDWATRVHMRRALR